MRKLLRSKFIPALIVALALPVLATAQGRAVTTSGIMYVRKMLNADGTIGAPSYAFASTPGRGFYSIDASSVGYTAGSSTDIFRMDSGGIRLNASSTLGWGATTSSSTMDTFFARGAAGVLHLTGTSGTNGIRLQFNGLPTIGTCGTSPAITALSRDTAGSVNVGTGGTATSCTVNFNATWTNAPFCTANGTTTTPANVRAVAASASTTVLTLTAASAWAASEVVAWTCVGPK